MGDTPQQGSETRSSVLPSAAPEGLGFFGSPYNPADAMLTPIEIGVKAGDSMGDVMNAVKGVAFYADNIGFGAPSTGFTSGMPLAPLGVNYFIRSGKTCSNGAEMWTYMNGITEGNALGDRVKITMEQMGLPPLKGLAPGMIEDVKSALNPSPLMNSLFGSGYPKCKLVTLPVGDAYGRVRDPTTGEAWVDSPNTAIKVNNGYVQTKWVQDIDKKGNPINMSREEWEVEKKTFNPDGSPIKTDGFEGSMLTKPATIAVVAVLCIAAFSMFKSGRK
jgi:hypothetical protein